MTREEYTAQVLASLRRVTTAERASIQAEIDALMEDHICALLDLGYEPELAEERTMTFMGDPVEMGRALDPVEDPGGITYSECQAQGVRMDGTVVRVEEISNGLHR